MEGDTLDSFDVARIVVRRWLDKQSDKICDELSWNQVTALESLVATALIEAETHGASNEKKKQRKGLD